MRRLVQTALAACMLLAAPSAAAAAGPPLYADGHGGRIVLNGDWLFRADPADQGLVSGWAADPATDQWQAASVPSVWNATDVSDASMAGTVGWYRRDFRVPKSARGTRWVVRFESVNYFAKVFLNGTEVANHEGASIPFEVPLENLEEGVNRLVLRVDNRRTISSLPPGPMGGWWNYGGLPREVYLRPVRELDIDDAVARPLGGTSLLLRVTLANPGGGLKRGAVTAQVAGATVDLGSARVSSGRTRTVEKRIQIPGGKPWEPKRGRLYPVSFRVAIRGAEVARFNLHAGMRTVSIRGDGRLLVNGKPATLYGASVHEDDPERGNALAPSDRARQINLLRQAGATITRGHYPLHPDFLERADRAGIMVWEQVPVYQLRESVLRDPAVRQRALDYLAATIKRDQSHPSIVAWSIANELPATPGRGQTAYIREAAELVRRLDPTRPVAIDFAGYPTKNHIAAYDPVDALGINDYFGWYPGPTGQITNRDALGQYLDRMHRFYPAKGIFVTEFGAESNRRGPAEEKGTFEFQNDFMAFHLKEFAKRPFVNGAMTWILEDFRVRPGWEGGNPEPQPPYNQKGLVDERGRRKPAFGVTARILRRTKVFPKR